MGFIIDTMFNQFVYTIIYLLEKNVSLVKFLNNKIIKPAKKQIKQIKYIPLKVILNICFKTILFLLFIIHTIPFICLIFMFELLNYNDEDTGVLIQYLTWLKID